MIDFKFRPIDYQNINYNNNVEHYVIMAEYGSKHLLLSMPNLYLYEKTRSSTQTSKRYATLITKFYKFVSTLARFKGISPGDYHSHITNNELRHWQIQRQEQRVIQNRLRPSSATIYNDACVVLYFFEWLHDRKIATGVNIYKKTWVANFKNRRLLSYIEKRARSVLDKNSIKALDRQARQKKPKALISKQDIHNLIESYPDSAYKCLFKFALATAMRPMELVKFPYMGNGKNRHILPYSEMDQSVKTFTYEVLGKGSKYRDIIIPAYALNMLNSEYIETEYRSRAKLYEKVFGKKCPPSTLFLTAEGVPVSPKMISEATNYAKKLAVCKDPKFKASNIFYHTRKWWPTLMMIQHHNGEGILQKNAEVLDLALAEVLMNQLGHESFLTTYNHYLVMGRYLVMANKGITHETIHEKTINVLDAIEKYS